MSEENCAFCPIPEQITKWWYEDDVCRVMNTPAGTPMVVLNTHSETLTEEERDHITTIVTDYYGAHNLYTMMNHVEEHWHAHIREYEYEPTQPISTPSEEHRGDSA